MSSGTGRRRAEPKAWPKSIPTYGKEGEKCEKYRRPKEEGRKDIRGFRFADQ